VILVIVAQYHHDPYSQETLLATGGEDKFVTVYDVSNGDVQHCLKVPYDSKYDMHENARSTSHNPSVTLHWPSSHKTFEPVYKSFIFIQRVKASQNKKISKHNTKNTNQGHDARVRGVDVYQLAGGEDEEEEEDAEMPLLGSASTDGRRT
jgi:WD40 repeat protein